MVVLFRYFKLTYVNLLLAVVKELCRSFLYGDVVHVSTPQLHMVVPFVQTVPGEGNGMELVLVLQEDYGVIEVEIPCEVEDRGTSPGSPSI